MSKLLILCRHVQANPPATGLADFSRPLTDQGSVQAGNARQWLAQNQLKPGLLLSSPAARAWHTAQLLAGSESGTEITREPRLYEASLFTLLDLVNTLPATANEVLLVAHNPGLSYLATHLTGHKYDLETCQLLVLETEAAEWPEIGAASATEKLVFVPQTG